MFNNIRTSLSSTRIFSIHNLYYTFISLAIEKHFQHFGKHIIRRQGIKDSHASMQLTGIYRAENITSTTTFMFQQSRCNSAQTRAEQFVFQIGHSLDFIDKTVVISCFTTCKIAKLRENIPHPATGLIPSDNLLECNIVTIVPPCLCLNKSVNIRICQHKIRDSNMQTAYFSANIATNERKFM